MTTGVYFMAAKNMPSPIKIGCTNSCVNRLAAYSLWSPFPLEILAFIETKETTRRLRTISANIERRFHEKYVAYRLHHEWFEPCPELLADIAAINDGSFSIESLPQPTSLTWLTGNMKPETKASRIQAFNEIRSSRFLQQ